jgi:hypothetical protein
LVDPRRIELIKLGTKDMTVGDVFTLLKNQTEFTPLNYCMSDFINSNPADESIGHLLPKCTDGHNLFFFGSMFENYDGTKSWVLSIYHNLQGSPIVYLKRYLSELWYPEYWNIAVIKK